MPIYSIYLGIYCIGNSISECTTEAAVTLDFAAFYPSEVLGWHKFVHWGAQGPQVRNRNQDYFPGTFRVYAKGAKQQCNLLVSKILSTDPCYCHLATRLPGYDMQQRAVRTRWTIKQINWLGWAHTDLVCILDRDLPLCQVRFFDQVSKVIRDCFGFSSAYSVIGWQNSRYTLNLWEAVKP